MVATVIRADAVRTSETPNAAMTTLASPSLGGTQALSMWKVVMRAGGEGPLHRFDSEQIWTVLSGSAMVDVDGERVGLDAGDTMRIPGGDLRLVTAQTDAVFLVCGYSGARVSTPSGSHRDVTPPWIQ